MLLTHYGLSDEKAAEIYKIKMNPAVSIVNPILN